MVVGHTKLRSNPTVRNLKQGSSDSACAHGKSCTHENVFVRCHWPALGVAPTSNPKGCVVAVVWVEVGRNDDEQHVPPERRVFEGNERFMKNFNIIQS
jgi:hypothetical protein